MRVFLLSVLAVIVIGVGAWLILEGGLRRNSGTAFALSSARVNEADKPDPRGFMSSARDPAGGATSGRSQTAGAEGNGQPRPAVR
jgi:hypothetical protein